MRRVIKSIAALTLVLAIASLAGFESFFFPQSDDNIDNGHEYVDLGLPSGTLWATCNVGAKTPEGYGSYFAWGETRSKSVFDWDTLSIVTVQWILSPNIVISRVSVIMVSPIS